MSKFEYYSHSTQQENYVCKHYKVKPNTPYEYEDTFTEFKCLPANQQDKKAYRITKGVIGEKSSVYLIATNLPADIDVGDRVVFMGRMLNVDSIGYVLNDNGIVDASIMSEEYLVARSPKGITLS